jgi:threonylcarbamoyladenosine tRNA methylthiotransferase MtaB
MNISLHVFTYSERDNTEAAAMEGLFLLMFVPNVAKCYAVCLLKHACFFTKVNWGSNRTVLFESENKEGYIHGFTENYVKVKTPWNPELVNTLHYINLTKIDEDGSVRMDFVSAFLVY